MSPDIASVSEGQNHTTHPPPTAPPDLRDTGICEAEGWKPDFDHDHEVKSEKETLIGVCKKSVFITKS